MHPYLLALRLSRLRKRKEEEALAHSCEGQERSAGILSHRTNMFLLGGMSSPPP